jgi:hypothetical protein
MQRFLMVFHDPKTGYRPQDFTSRPILACSVSKTVFTRPFWDRGNAKRGLSPHFRVVRSYDRTTTCIYSRFYQTWAKYPLISLRLLTYR